MQNFVEFEYYPPSNEAAAFFSVVLTDDEKHIGWVVLQCETNSLNAILQQKKGLGRTGEVYLVNKKKLMLSESRFMADSTILRQKVDTQAVLQAIGLIVRNPTAKERSQGVQGVYIERILPQSQLKGKLLTGDLKGFEQ